MPRKGFQPSCSAIAQEFSEGLREMRLSFVQYAQLTNVHPRTVSRWANGERRLRGPALNIFLGMLRAYRCRGQVIEHREMVP